MHWWERLSWYYVYLIESIPFLNQDSCDNIRVPLTANCEYYSESGDGNPSDLLLNIQALLDIWVALLLDIKNYLN